MITYFVVQGFTLGGKGALIPDVPVQALTQAHAESLAERLSHKKAGVVAFSRTGDPSTGEFDDAVILAAYGQLPQEVEDLRLVA